MNPVKSQRAQAIAFAAFVSLHFLVALALIALFNHLYRLNYRLIVCHLIAVGCLYAPLLLVGIAGASFRRWKTRTAFRYVTGLLWGSTAVFLYATYLLAFLGKQNNGRIFNFPILFGYLSHLRAFSENTGLSAWTVYGILVMGPLLIITVYLALSGFIVRGMLTIQHYLAVRNSRKFAFVGIIVLAAGLLAIKRAYVHRVMLRNEEPLVSVFEGKRVQGLYLSIWPEGIRVRQRYPKTIPFVKKNVILVIVDALRADHLRAYGYRRSTSPFLDSLYASGQLHRVKFALASASGSFPGVLSILRSRSWHTMSERNFSLPDLLYDQGYGLHFLVSGDHTRFYGLASYYGDSLAYYIDGGKTKKYTVNDDRLIFEGLDQIPQAGKKPAYFHFHLNSVHLAGKRMPEFKKFLPDNDPMHLPANYVNNYDNGILQADAYLKKLFTRLRQKGYLQKNSIVVITADHGESLGERGLLGHAKNVYNEETSIPLLFYDQETVTYPSLDFAMQPDIAATIVDRLGLPQPPTWEGYSLLRKRPPAYGYLQMVNDYAVVHQEGEHLYKYLVNARLNTEELYDLAKDRRERHNLIHKTDKAVVDRFRKKALPMIQAGNQ